MESNTAARASGGLEGLSLAGLLERYESGADARVVLEFRS